MRRQKMSLEEYQRLSFSLAWKREYINGCLVEMRRQVIVHATITVAPRFVNSPVPLRPVAESDELDLLRSFKAAFARAYEYSDETKKQFAESARQGLRHFFRGPFHLPLPASRVALAPSGFPGAGQPIGAALVLKQDDGWALLDMIFVSPAWQRRNIATALAVAALTALHELGGYRTLVSRYHLGNEASCAWHHRFGFTDEPDLGLAQLRLHAAAHELNRLDRVGQLTPQINRRLSRERIRWQREVKRLEAFAKQGRLEEVDPWRKWRRKRRSEDEISIANPPFVPTRR